jgi:predicted ATPase
MRLTYVIGCSGAGKSTLHDRLNEEGQPGVEELDAHPSGMPSAGHVPWLEWRAAEVLAEVTELARQTAGPDTQSVEYQHRVVVGIVWPFRLIMSNAWRPAQEAGVQVRFVFIDRPWDDVAATLSARYEADGRDPEEAAEELENNRRLQRTLRTQVEAIEGGVVVADGDLGEAMSYLWSEATW